MPPTAATAGAAAAGAGAGAPCICCGGIPGGPKKRNPPCPPTCTRSAFNHNGDEEKIQCSTDKRLTSERCYFAVRFKQFVCLAD